MTKSESAKSRIPIQIWACDFKLLLFFTLEAFLVDGFHPSGPLLHGWLLEGLASPQFADRAGFLEFSLESLQSPIDVFAFLDGNDDHNFTTSFFFCGCKGRKKSFIFQNIHKSFHSFRRDFLDVMDPAVGHRHILGVDDVDGHARAGITI